MQKWLKAIILFDICAGLLVLGTLGQRHLTGAQKADISSITVCTSRITADSPLISPDDSDRDAFAREDETLCRIALTFDDGPHFRYTCELLDGLKERGIHATFFVTGEHAQANPKIIARMQEEGHLIGNHTYSHIQLTKSNRRQFKEELIKTNKIISEITGEEVTYVRPPYGSWDKKFEKELNMIPVLWTVDPLDWCSTNVAAIKNKIVSKAEENDIILMHDYYASSVEAALEVVDELQTQGFTFVTVDEILFD